MIVNLSHQLEQHSEVVDTKTQIPNKILEILIPCTVFVYQHFLCVVLVLKVLAFAGAFCLYQYYFNYVIIRLTD